MKHEPKTKKSIAIILKKITCTSTAFFVIITLQSKMGSASRFFVICKTIQDNWDGETGNEIGRAGYGFEKSSSG
jgi:hypothetical protein